MKKYITFLLAFLLYSEGFSINTNSLVLGSGVPVFLKLSESWSTKSRLCPQFVVANNVTDSKGNILIMQIRQLNPTAKLNEQRESEKEAY